MSLSTSSSTESVEDELLEELVAPKFLFLLLLLDHRIIENANGCRTSTRAHKLISFRLLKANWLQGCPGLNVHQRRLCGKAPSVNADFKTLLLGFRDRFNLLGS